MFSATDVANFLACHHLSTLDRAQAAGEIERPFFQDPGIELPRELGAEHEQAYRRQGKYLLHCTLFLIHSHTFNELHKLCQCPVSPQAVRVALASSDVPDDRLDQ